MARSVPTYCINLYERSLRVEGRWVASLRGYRSVLLKGEERGGGRSGSSMFASLQTSRSALKQSNAKCLFKHLPHLNVGTHRWRN